MTKMRILALLLCFALLLGGCSAEAPKELANDAAPAPTAGNGVYGETADQNASVGVETNRKLIRTITIDAETANLDTILADLDAQLALLGGYVQNKSVQNRRNGNVRFATITLRIPADQVDSFVQHVQSATNILSSSEKAEDVTLKYSATESRIKALETEEARLLEMLEKAATLSDLLTLEAKLADVRQELETVKSQLKLYDSLIDYGTIHLTITEVTEYTVKEEKVEPSAWQRIRTGFVASLKGVWKILSEIFIFLIIALPYLAIPGGILLVVWIVYNKKYPYGPKKFFRKKTKSVTAPSKDTEKPKEE